MYIPNNQKDLYCMVMHEHSFSPGDTVWACNGQTAKIAPHPGVLVCDRTPPANNQWSLPKIPKTPNGPVPGTIWYFIPYDNHQQLNWQQKRTINCRFYATTEAECWSLYYAQLEQQIKQCKHRIQQLQNILAARKLESE